MKNSELWKKRGQRIRNGRLAKNLLQKDLSKLLGVGVSAISDYELGLKKIDFDDLKLLCKMLDIDISTL